MKIVRSNYFNNKNNLFKIELYSNVNEAYIQIASGDTEKYIKNSKIIGI